MALPRRDSVEFGKLLVPTMISAIRDELPRCVELFPRFRQAGARLGGVGQGGRRRAWSDEAVQRREGFAARQREPRSLERAIAEIEPHRPRLGDFFDIVEVARGAVPVADGAAESGASEQAASEVVAVPRGAQA